MIEAALGDFRVVLGADRKQDTPLAQGQAIALECRVRLAERRLLADLQLADAVVSDHAAPQRVVEVEDQALLRSAEGRADQARERARKLEARLGSGEDLVSVPTLPVEPARMAHPGG